GLITAPWQLTIALAVSGVFSGIIAPAVAFVSVSVPESRLNSSLSTLSGAQYIGITAGPALGAGLAAFFGFRGAILVAAVVPLITGAAVHLFVPGDETKPISGEGDPSTSLSANGRPQLEPFRMSFQFGLCVLLYFVLFA